MLQEEFVFAQFDKLFFVPFVVALCAGHSWWGEPEVRRKTGEEGGNGLDNVVYLFNFRMRAVSWKWLHAPAYNIDKIQDGFLVFFVHIYKQHMYIFFYMQVKHAGIMITPAGRLRFPSRNRTLTPTMRSLESQRDQKSQRIPMMMMMILQKLPLMDLLGRTSPLAQHQTKWLGRISPLPAQTQTKGLGSISPPPAQFPPLPLATVLSQERRIPMAPLLQPVPAQAGLISILRSWDQKGFFIIYRYAIYIVIFIYFLYIYEVNIYTKSIWYNLQ